MEEDVESIAEMAGALMCIACLISFTILLIVNGDLQVSCEGCRFRCRFSREYVQQVDLADDLEKQLKSRYEVGGMPEPLFVPTPHSGRRKSLDDFFQGLRSPRRHRVPTPSSTSAETFDTCASSERSLQQAASVESPTELSEDSSGDPTLPCDELSQDKLQGRRAGSQLPPLVDRRKNSREVCVGEADLAAVDRKFTFDVSSSDYWHRHNRSDLPQESYSVVATSFDVAGSPMIIFEETDL